MQQSHIVSWIDVIIDSWADRVPSHGSIPYRPMNRSHIGSWVDPTLSHGLIVYLLIYDTTSSHEPIILSHEPILYCLMDRSYIVSWIDPIYIVSWVDPTSSHGSIPHDHRMRLFDCLTRCWIFVPDYWQGSRYLPREVVCKPFLLPGNGGGWLLVHFGEHLSLVSHDDDWIVSWDGLTSFYGTIWSSYVFFLSQWLIPVGYRHWGLTLLKISLDCHQRRDNKGGTKKNTLITDSWHLIVSFPLVIYPDNNITQAQWTLVTLG